MTEVALTKEIQRLSDAAFPARTPKTPKERDTVWGALNELAMLAALNSQWGIYTTARTGMAEHLHREKKHKHSIVFWIYVTHLNLTGCHNAVIVNGAASEMAPLYEPFEKAIDHISHRIDVAAKKGRLSEDEISEALAEAVRCFDIPDPEKVRRCLMGRCLDAKF